MRETYIWSKARHENVQELTGVIMFRGLLGMVSPWMENGHLQQYLKTHPEVERFSLVGSLDISRLLDLLLSPRSAFNWRQVWHTYTVLAWLV